MKLWLLVMLAVAASGCVVLHCPPATAPEQTQEQKCAALGLWTYQDGPEKWCGPEPKKDGPR